MNETTTYPARLTGQLDPAMSRWLWLIKWLLVIPHVITLVFLWVGTMLSTIVAGFAILFTGRYPRRIFNYNVGVMRWTWRVAFYAFDAFGTDRYPPWTLRPDPSYPADFTVDYPERLSRGLVLVKWWLLALPHYIIVGLLSGGSGNGSLGLISVLAIIAAAILLFTGNYPRSLFDLVMGLNRWCYRVLAYAALMTDVYPPFRLDVGGTDATPTQTPPVSQPASA
jgi:hypothetical protein